MPKRKMLQSMYIRLLPIDAVAINCAARSMGISRSEFARRAINNELNGTRLKRIRQCLDRKGWHETGDC